MSIIKQLENALPPKRNQDNLPYEPLPETYGNSRLESYKNGYNDCIKKVRTESLPKMMKILIEEIEKRKQYWKDKSWNPEWNLEIEDRTEELNYILTLLVGEDKREE